jgi:hypothetical protein
MSGVLLFYILLVNLSENVFLQPFFKESIDEASKIFLAHFVQYGIVKGFSRGLHW